MEKEGFKGGWHPLYLWAIVCVTLSYIGPFLTFKLVNIQEIPLTVGLFGPLLIPLLLPVINTIIAVALRNKVHRYYFLNTAMLMKYMLIPYHIVAYCLAFLFAIGNMLLFVLIMFSGFMMAIGVCITDWLVMAESIPFMFVFLKDSSMGSLNKKNYVTVMRVLQFFPVVSLISSMVAALKEKRCIVMTVVAVIVAILIILAIILLVVLGIAGAVLSNMG